MKGVHKLLSQVPPVMLERDLLGGEELRRYLTLRASEEAERAILSANPHVAGVHRRSAELYRTRHDLVFANEIARRERYAGSYLPRAEPHGMESPAGHDRMGQLVHHMLSPGGA